MNPNAKRYKLSIEIDAIPSNNTNFSESVNAKMIFEQLVQDAIGHNMRSISRLTAKQSKAQVDTDLMSYLEAKIATYEGILQSLKDVD